MVSEIRPPVLSSMKSPALSMVASILSAFSATTSLAL